LLPFLINFVTWFLIKSGQRISGIDTRERKAITRDVGFTFGELRFASYLFDLNDLPPNELINHLLI
jgi:hypothetical protein